MTTYQSKSPRGAAVAPLALAVALAVGAGQTTASTDSEVRELRKQLEGQQRLLEELQRQLAEQKQLTDHILRRGAEMEEEIQRAEADAQRAREEAEVAKRAADRDVRETVRLPEGAPVELVLSGQVNRMVNIADDGKTTKAYFVDNDASNSRFRLVGTAPVTDDLTIGTRIEIAVAPDESGKVNQEDESTGDFFDQRWAEVSLTSKRFGKLSLGKGDTASNNSGEVDLSKTDVIQYASIADIAGGLKFRDDDDQLTDVRIADAFQDEDGLSRASRLRYDTPVWNGLYLATSAASDQRVDGSIWWSGKISGISAAGAFAVADRSVKEEDLRYDGSFSLLHEATGLNFTFSAGVTERDEGDDATNYYAKVGWLADIFSVGKTAFGIDYTKSENVPTTSEDGDSISLAVVQSFNKYGTEVYSIVRNFSLDGDQGQDFQDIFVGSVGARVKF